MDKLSLNLTRQLASDIEIFKHFKPNPRLGLKKLLLFIIEYDCGNWKCILNMVRTIVNI